MSEPEMKQYMVHNMISLSWRIGCAIATAQANDTICNNLEIDRRHFRRLWGEQGVIQGQNCQRHQPHG